MSKKMHTRIINLSYFDEDLPKFASNVEQDEWHRALGRMVAYGLYGDWAEDTVQYVNLVLQRSDEIMGVYARPLPTLRKDEGDGQTWYWNSAQELVDCFIKDLYEKSQAQGQSFVMGAVKHDGKYGFHS